MVNNENREDWLVERFERIGTLKPGHFVAKSGLHLDYYVDKDVVTSDPVFTDELANLLVLMHDREWFGQINLVVAPAAGAILFGGMLAHHLGCRFAFTEKVNGRQVLRPSFASLIVPGTRVLIAEDIVTEGTTVSEVVAEIRNFGGEVFGAAVIWNRGRAKLDFPIRSVVNRQLPAWFEEECPLCKQKISVNTNLGHGSRFLQKYGHDPEKWPANRDLTPS